MSARVLVVDDSPMDRRTVGTLLSAIPGVEVAFANNVDEAHAVLSTCPPHLVVTDLVMPERDGLELRVVRASDSEARAHEAQLDLLDDKSSDGSLWRRAEA